MATTIPYSSREFETILTAMRANLRTAMPGINDFLESNQGRYLLDQFAATAEMLGFTIDRTAADLYVDTVETRPSLASLLKLIGYQMANPKPELVQITIARDERSAAFDLVIPRYTKVVAQAIGGSGTSGNVIPFSTATAVVIPKGLLTATTYAVQGEWKVLQYIGNGTPYQAYVLASKRVAESYVRVWVDGVEWPRATDNTFVAHTPHDLVFRTVNLPDRRTLVEFGGEGEGFPPPNGRAIRIEYMDTLGPRGHIDAGQIATVSGAGLIATNDEPSTGGIDFELIETARARYPIVFRAMRRAVTLEDFEALAREVPGVMQAHAVDRNIDPTLPFMVVRLYVIGEGGFVSESLNKVTFDVLKQRRVNAQRFEVWSPDEQNVGVQGQVRVWRQFNPSDVIANVTVKIKDFFLMTSLPDCEVKLGQAVSFSRLIAAIQDVEGVASVILTSPVGDMTVDANEFVRLDSVSFTLAGVV